MGNMEKKKMIYEQVLTSCDFRSENIYSRQSVLLHNFGNIFIKMDVTKNLSFCKNLKKNQHLEDPYRKTIRTFYINNIYNIHISFILKK